jgi:uncharacterized protein (TIGR03086 family)
METGHRMTGSEAEAVLMTTATTTNTLDARPIFGAALTTATAVVAEVRPEQLDGPTPCSEFTVRDLLGHLVGMVDRITAIGRGENPFTVPPRDVAGDAWLDAWNAAVDEYVAVWTDDAALEVPSPLPWAPGDGRVVVAMYVTELTIHTWDLATALGITPAWDQAVLELAVQGVGTGMPATDRHATFAPIKAQLPPDLAALPDPFADAVPVPDDAPLIDRIVAWSGRTP